MEACIDSKCIMHYISYDLNLSPRHSYPSLQTRETKFQTYPSILNQNNIEVLLSIKKIRV